MKVIQKLFRGTTVLLSLLCFSHAVFADGTENSRNDYRFTNISVQNDINDALVNELNSTDYGSGLLRTIFGDFKEAFCFGDNECIDTFKAKIATSDGNPVEQSFYANIFLPQTQLSKMFSSALSMATLFSMAILAFLIFFGFFYAVISTASTANQRSLSDLYTDITFHARWVVGLVMIFPTSSGYSLGTLAMMKLMGYSTSMANVVYTSAITSIDHKTFEERLVQTIKHRVQSTNDNSVLMRNLLMSAYCLHQMNTNTSSGSVLYGTVLGIKDNELTLNFGPTFGEKGRSYDFENQGTADGTGMGMSTSGNVTSASIGNGRGVVGRTMNAANGVNIQEYSKLLTNRSANYCGSISLPISVVANKGGLDSLANMAWGMVSKAAQEQQAIMEVAQQKNRYSWAQLQGVLAATARAYTFFEQNAQKSDGRTSALDSAKYLELNRTLIEMEAAYYNQVRAVFNDSGLKPIAQSGSGVYPDMFNYRMNEDNHLHTLTGGTSSTFKDANATIARQHILTMIEMGIAQRRDRLGASLGESNLNAAMDELVKKAKADGTSNLLYRVAKQAVENGWISAGANFNALIGISSGYNAFSDFSPTYQTPSFFNDDTEKDEKDSANANVNDHSRIDKTDYNRILLALDSTGFEMYSPVISDVKIKSGAFKYADYNATETYLNHLRSANYRGIQFANLLGYNPYRGEDEIYVYKHPILNMKQRGDSMLFIAQGIFLGNLTIDVASAINNSTGAGKNDPAGKQKAITDAANMLNSSGNAQKMGGASSFVNFLTEIISKLKAISTPIAWVLLFIGSVFAIYLPLLPTFYWVFGVLTWILSFIVNIVALPVAALGMLMAKGQDFFGRAIAFLLMFIETNLRPSLMVVGLFATALMSATFMDLAVRLLDLAYMNASPNDSYLGSIIYGFIRCFFEYQILVNCCSLIITIPQRVIAHIQGSAAIDDTSENQSNRLMGAITQGRHEITGALKMRM